MSIRIKYEQHLKQVSDKLVFMCRRIEGTIDGAMTALMTYNTELARQIIDADDEIDRLEHDLEQDCLKVLLLEQPVAGDVNGDKSVTVDDAILVLRHIAGLETLSDSALTAAEMNGDGSVDVNDAIAILSKIAGAN